MSSDAMHAYYEAGHEHDRLTRGISIEMVRTQELILRHAPAPPAVVYDIGGGTGPYAFWLAGLGYAVHLRDLMPLHIEQARERMRTDHPLASIEIGDARHLDLPDASAQVVLLLGPLYHLTEQTDRIQAFREALRLLAPGGVVLAAAIPRHASLLDGMKRGVLDDPAYRAIVRADLATGQHRNPTHELGYFTTAYMHQPEELKMEIQEAGFANAAVFAIEGPLWLIQAARERWDAPEQRDYYLEALRWIEQDMALLSASSHIMGVGKKPAS